MGRRTMVPLLLTLLFIVARFVIMKLDLVASSSVDYQRSSGESEDPKDFATKRVHYLFVDHFPGRILSF